MTKRLDATHVATSDKSRGTWFSFVKAFTLAEVLITLGIIGVVAAMTIPTLVKNYQKTVWVNQLKKSVSTIEQGFQKRMADEGIDDLRNSEIMFIELTEDEASYLERIFSKYFNIVKSEKYYGKTTTFKNYKFLNGEEYDDDVLSVFYLNDGTKLFVYASWYVGKFDMTTFVNAKDRGSHYSCKMMQIIIDVNGDKGPNILGRDLFIFELGENGHLYPMGGRDYAQTRNLSPITSNSNIAYWKNSNDCSSSGYGYQCAGRIIESGWKMDY